MLILADGIWPTYMLDVKRITFFSPGEKIRRIVFEPNAYWKKPCGAKLFYEKRRIL